MKNEETNPEAFERNSNISVRNLAKKAKCSNFLIQKIKKICGLKNVQNPDGKKFRGIKTDKTFANEFFYLIFMPNNGQ